MRYVRDALGTRHDVDPTRHRIVSLVPSTTETVCTLGARDKLVGVTRYCIRPSDVRQRARVVGGTKSPRIEEILGLEPDLVLANQEENRRPDVERLAISVPVFVFYPRDVPTALADVRVLGELIDRSENAVALADEIEAARAALEARGRFTYLYFIWRNPYMVAGHGTFVDALLAEIGGENSAPERPSYPEMSIEEIAAAGAEVVLLSSEPFPFTEANARELQSDAGVSSPLLVDGQLLTWHGARLVDAFPYLNDLSTSIERARTR